MASLRDLLLTVREERGILTAEVVVDVARDVAHPLHSRFEWDDRVAGAAHRVEQARGLIRSVRVQYTAPDGSASDLRGFVSVSRGDTPAREYTPVDEVAADPVLGALVLRDAEREWRTLYARYQHLAEFVALVQKDIAA